MFKVGDKVKVVKKEHCQDFAEIGMCGEILSGSADDWEVFIKDIGHSYRFADYELELVSFTKSDLKENHIVKNRGNHKFMWGDRPTDTYNSDLTNIYDNILDIMEVWEFETLIWKREESILDDKEKEWLNHFIKSTNIKVKYIVKYDGLFYNDREFLNIYYNINDDIESTILPYFKKGSMYKGMELDKKYTLEELGLED